MSAQAEPGAVDVARLVNDAPWSTFQKGVLVLAALGYAVDGLANQVLGLAIPALIHDWQATKGDFAPVAAAGLIGVAIGTAAGGVCGDRFGRRVALIGSVLLFGVMTSLTAAVDGIPALLVLRLIAGLGIGGAIPNGTALIAEFTPAHRRSLAIALGMVFIPVGALLSGLLGVSILPSAGWRGLFLIAGLLPLALGIVFLVLLPEFPRFLTRLPHAQDRISRILGRMGHRFPPGTRFSEPPTAHGHTALRALFGSEVRRDTLALWSAFFFCLLASYSMFSWVPTMLAGQGFDLAGTSLGMSAFNFGGLMGGILGGWLIGRFGSRVSVLGMAGGAVAGAVALGVLPFDPGRGFGLVLGVLVVEGVFVAGIHNGIYTLAAHVYPPFVRASGVGTASAVGRLGAVLSSYTGVITLQLGGAESYFVVIAACLGVSLVSLATIRRQIPAGTAPPGPGSVRQQAPVGVAGE